MTDTLASRKGDKVHTRGLRIETFTAGPGQIIVEGELRDERLAGMYSLSGNWREPGPVHGMTVRFLVGDLPPRILEAEAEMFQVPLAGCRETQTAVKKLVGLPVTYGFTLEVKKRMGGARGCTHLVSLILAMAAAIIQSLAAARGQRKLDPRERKFMIHYVKNSCRVWREDGEFFRAVLAEIESASGGNDEPA